MTQSPPPGWYTDPSNGTGMRWWDGTAWSMNTMPMPEPPAAAQPVAQPVTAAAPVAQGTPVATQPYGGYTVMPSGSVGPQRRSANQYAFITFGVVALYVLLAITTGIVFIGIVPILMAVRSFQARESLAPVAIGAAVVSVVIAFTVLTGH
jgi:hypothetical protein